MHATFKLFIGSNNETGELELNKIKTLSDIYFGDGFTLQEAIGYYKGTEEATAILTVSTDEVNVLNFIHQAKITLEQESIGMIALPEMAFI